MSNKITPEFYLSRLEFFKAKQKELNDLKAKLRLAYIESNKPCNIGDTVRIVSSGGNVLTGQANSFSLFDTVVFVDTIANGAKRQYQTKPPKEFEILAVKSDIEETVLEKIED